MSTKAQFHKKCTGKCAVCGNESIGIQSNGYVSREVCHEHAWPALKKEKPGYSGAGINISWTRFPDREEKSGKMTIEKALAFQESLLHDDHEVSTNLIPELWCDCRDWKPYDKTLEAILDNGEEMPMEEFLRNCMVEMPIIEMMVKFPGSYGFYKGIGGFKGIYWYTNSMIEYFYVARDSVWWCK